MTIEICVDSVEGALAAERGGADRVELCQNLLEGGTTPSVGCLRLTRRYLRIGLHAILRPRGGDFLYSDLDTEVMLEDIRVIKASGADGVVVGALNPDGDVDLDCVRALITEARPMSVTFHRAFDMCRDPAGALEDLIRLKVDRVLTSGQEQCAADGLELIAAIQRRSRGRIQIMAGGGITPGTVKQIVRSTGISEIHLSARSAFESGMRFRNARCSMGGTPGASEFSRRTTDESIVRSVVEALSGMND